ncbi:MAG TPA: 50S ribosomal protein L18 [Micavibrio sp.]|jgi:large subunit ribosomal protein L18|nr:50S ribosomal protein L18 [Pseudomonadota bacterium]HIF25411.1 50S ribosomal protein L18 [Micavibrio sp.]HIL27680.1 50S ribosomal protein L18 [Micavibrio sp.]
MTVKLTGQQRRSYRTRNKLRQVNILRNATRDTRPRLSVHRTGQHIYAQIIDDVKGVTLAAASTLDKELKLKKGSDVDAASKVGKLVAERAKKAGVEKVQFDRGSFVYHGRVKALAEGAREGGLEF